MTTLSFAAQFSGSNQMEGNDTAVAKVSEVVKQCFDAAGENIKIAYRAVPVPSNATGSFGAVAIVSTVKAAGEAAPVNFYHLLMIERARQSPLDKMQCNIAGQVFELPVCVGDAYTKEYRDVVRNYLERNTSVAGKYQAAGYQIIYSETDLESATKFEPVVTEALRAIGNVSSALDANAATFNLDLINGSAGKMSLHTQIAADVAVREPNGMPVRADLTVVLSMAERADPKDPRTMTNFTPMCSTSAYVDLVFTPQQQGFGQYGMMQAPKPIAIPRITISNSVVHMPVSSLEFSLLNIGAMVTILSNRTYGVVWRPNFGTDDNLRDLGALGWIAPQLSQSGVPAALDLSDPMVLQQFLASTMNQSVIFSMEFRQGGAGNWVNDVFLMAAAGGVEGEAARKRIIQAANRLTGDAFSVNFPQNAQIVSPTIEVFPSGYFTLGSETVDSNKLDLLAITNLFGGKDVNVVWTYLNSIHDQAVPANLRMHRRLTLLNNIAKGFTLKSYGSKVNFSGEFIAALAKSIADKKVSFTGNSLGGTTDQQVYNQTADNWANYMVDPAKVANLYTQSTITSTSAQGFQVGSSASYF